MIVVVTGGRDWTASPGDAAKLLDRLDELECTIIRHGGCSGLDLWAAGLAKLGGYELEAWPATVRDAMRLRLLADRKIPIGRVVVPPPWRRWPSAGPLRNVDMTTGAGYVLAYPGGRGTASCCRAGAVAGAVVEAM